MTCWRPGVKKQVIMQFRAAVAIVPFVEDILTLYKTVHLHERENFCLLWCQT